MNEQLKQMIDLLDKQIMDLRPTLETQRAVANLEQRKLAELQSEYDKLKQSVDALKKALATMAVEA